LSPLEWGRSEQASKWMPAENWPEQKVFSISLSVT